MEIAPRHQCLIYEGSPASQLRGLAAITIEKLKANSRCLFLNSPTMVAGLRSYLAASGLDVAKEVKRGSLVLSSEQNHLRNGQFDIKRMLRLLQDTLRQALYDGYEGLFATGDMMWEFGSEKNLDKLLEYECGLEQLLQEHPTLAGICQYHKDILPITAIQVALYAHRSVYINQTLSRINPFYTQPETLRHERANGPTKRVQGMLAQLSAPFNQ